MIQTYLLPVNDKKLITSHAKDISSTQPAVGGKGRFVGFWVAVIPLHNGWCFDKCFAWLSLWNVLFFLVNKPEILLAFHLIEKQYRFQPQFGVWQQTTDASGCICFRRGAPSYTGTCLCHAPGLRK